MKKIIHSNIAIALIINLFFLIICITCADLHFGVMDDYFMAAILSGAHGTTYNPHLYFVNAIYGYALLPLYYLFPKIGWYYIGEMLGVFLSFSTISYILIKKLDKFWGSLFSSLLLAFMVEHFYLNVQFTQCAALFSATGMLCTLWAINEKKHALAILGGFLFFWGTLMRYDAFLMGMPFLAASMLTQFKVCLKNWKPVIIATIILSTAIIGAKHFNDTLYDTQEYKPYRAIQGPRAAFGDGNNYDKQAIYEDLEEDGKFGDDYIMLTQWKFYDTETFTPDSLFHILNYTYKYKNDISSLKSPINVVSALSNSISQYTCWIFFIFAIIILTTNHKRGLYPWIALLITLSLMAYLLYINRLVLRVENGFWLYASFLAIPHFGKIKEIPHKFIYASLGIIAVASLINILSIPTEQKRQETYDKVFEYVKNNPNTMFLLSMPQYTAFASHKLPPYLAEPIGGFKRTISFGYWTPYLPEITQSLKEFGITNPMKDVVNDNVIVIGEGNLKEYLQRHYYDSVTIDTIKKIDNIKFFKYSAISK